MHEHVSTTFLVVDYRKYPEDTVFDGISAYEGQQHIIVKGGAKPESKRAKQLDIGNLVKAKCFQRHHLYLTEAETIETFSNIKHALSPILLYQAVLRTLRITYMIPEQKLFQSIISGLKEANDETDFRKQELILFMLLMKLLAHYQIVGYPLLCTTCRTKLYEGSMKNGELYCTDHADAFGGKFSIRTPEARLATVQLFMREYLNVTFPISP